MAVHPSITLLELHNTILHNTIKYLNLFHYRNKVVTKLQKIN